MKRTIGYLSLSAVAFLLPLLFLYIGFISPANAGAESPFIRMTVCTVLGFLLTSLFTRFIHPYSGLAGLDSAQLNLGFTVFVEFVSFGGSTLEPYMEGLSQKNSGGIGEYFYIYVRYVFMISQLLIALRTFLHSAFLGLLKTIMKHAD